jgi:DNA-binding transcriptional ArsR family regulator
VKIWRIEMTEIIFDEKTGEIYDIFQGLWALANYELVKDRKVKLGIEEENQYEKELISLVESEKVDIARVKKYFHPEFEPEKTLLFNNVWEYKTLMDYLDFINNFDDLEIRKNLVRLIGIITGDLADDVKLDDEKIRKIATDDEKVLKYITEKDISSSLKWEIYLLLKDEKKYLGEFTKFIRQYNKEYRQASISRKKTMGDFNIELKENLKNHGVNYLNQVINHLVKLENYKKIHVTTSAVKTLYIGEELDLEICSIVIGIDLKDVWGSMDKKGVIESNLELLRDVFDSTRFQIIKLLIKRDYYVQEIANALDLSKANVSYHMNFLLKSKIVTIVKDGQRNYYHLNKEAIKASYVFIHNELEL